jgi:hypothetical protein
MSNDQKRVLAGMAAASVFSAVFFLVVFRLTEIDITPPGGIDTAWRLEYALKCDVFAALCLLAGVGWISNRRFLMADAIGGDPSPALEIDRRYVQNTTEQLILAIVAHLALVCVVDANSLRAVAVLAMLFVIGRATFWIGYHRSGTARAFGFSTTFYPTVGAYVFVLIRLIN